MTIKVTILGCGNSAGVPTIGNYWGNCDPDEPKNRRLRPCVAVQSETATIMIDSGPDFKQQVNQAGIEDIDAVLYTHAHGDHINGVDDLRVIRNRRKQMVNVYGTPEAMQELRERFSYLFEEKQKIYPQVLVPHIFNAEHLGHIQTIGDIDFIPFEQDHGTCRSLGYRFGDLAYSTDMINLDESAIETLQGIKTWIIDGAGYKMPRNMVHCTLKDVIALNDRVGADRVILTHLSPQMDYQTVLKETPDYIEPAYDGMEFIIHN